MFTFDKDNETISLSSIESSSDNKVGYVNEEGKLIFPNQKTLGHAWANKEDKGIIKVPIDDGWMSIYGYTGKYKTISTIPLLPKVKYLCESAPIKDCANVYNGNGRKVFSNNIFVDDEYEVKLIDTDNEGQVLVSDIEIESSNFVIINYNNILCTTKGNYHDNEILINNDGEWSVMFDDPTIDSIYWDFHNPYWYFLGGITYNDDSGKSLIYYDKNIGNNIHTKYTDADERINGYLWIFIFTESEYNLICDVDFLSDTHGLFDVKRGDIFLDNYYKIISRNDGVSLYFWEHILFFRNDNMYVLIPVNDLLEAINEGTYVNLSDPKYTEYSDADNKYTKIDDEYYIRVREPYGKWGIIDAHGDMIVKGYSKIGDLYEYETEGKIYAEKDGKIGYIIFDKYDRGKFVEEKR